ncbi:MAG: carbohydrate binding domain-containing protein [Pseudomonadota bacterium]
MDTNAIRVASYPADQFPVTLGFEVPNAARLYLYESTATTEREMANGQQWTLANNIVSLVGDYTGKTITMLYEPDVILDQAGARIVPRDEIAAWTTRVDERFDLVNYRLDNALRTPFGQAQPDNVTTFKDQAQIESDRERTEAAAAEAAGHVSAAAASATAASAALTQAEAARDQAQAASRALKPAVRATATDNQTLFGATTIDGVSLVDGDRVLLASQTDAIQNGIYIVRNAAWERAPDFLNNTDVEYGTSVYTTQGALNGRRTYFLNTTNPNIGVAPLAFQAVTDLNINFGDRPRTVDGVDGGVFDRGTIVTDGKVMYVYDEGTLIPDMPGWSPFGPVYLQHFGHNETPGTTDLAAALVLLRNYIRTTPSTVITTVSLNHEICGIGSTVFWNAEADGVHFVDGAFKGVGTLTDYPSLDTNPLTGTAQAGPMIAFTLSDRITLSVSILCNRVCSGVRFKQTEYCNVTPLFYVHGFAPGGYGLRTDTTALEFKGDRPKIEQYTFGETGFDNQANRDGFCFMMMTADWSMDTPTANYAKYQIYQDGFGSWELISPHGYAGSLATVTNADEIYSVYINNPSNGRIHGGYFDQGSLYINADNLHSATAKTFTCLGGWFPWSGSAGSNTYQLQIHTTVANNDLAGLSLADCRFVPRPVNVQFTTSGSGSFATVPNMTVENVRQADGTPLTSVGGVMVHTDEPSFATRGDLKTFWDKNNRVPAGRTVPAGGYTYMHFAASVVIPDLLGLHPNGDGYPDHWIEHAAPGTTDMSDAIKAALDWSGSQPYRARLRGVDYRVTKNMRIYARNNPRLYGEGLNSSRIVPDAGDYSVFTFYTGQTNAAGTPLSCRGVEMIDCQMAATGTGMTGGWFVEFEERCIGGIFDRFKQSDFYNGMDLTAAAYTNLGVIYQEGPNRTTQGGTMLRFTSSDTAGAWNPNAAANVAKPTDIKVLSLQQNPQNPTLTKPYAVGVYIGAADGIYFSPGCHLRGATVPVVMETAKAPGRTVIASVDLRGVYFDGGVESHIVFRGYGNDETWTPTGGSETKIKFRSILIANCRFRAAESANGSIVADMTQGAVDLVTWRGGQSRDHLYSAIRDLRAAPGFTNLTIDGVEFSGNNTEGSAGHSDINLFSDGHHITSNTVKSGGQNNGGAGKNIVLKAGGTKASTVHGNDLTDSPVPRARRIDVQPTDAVYGNSGHRQTSRGTVTLADNNLTTAPKDFTDASWLKVNTTVTADAEAAPDGTTTADTIASGNATGQSLYDTLPVTPGSAYTVGFWVKLGTMVASDFKMAAFDVSGSAFIVSDLAPSAVLSTDTWTYVSFQFTAPAGCTSARAYPFRNSAAVTGTFHLWNARVELAGQEAGQFVSEVSSTAVILLHNLDVTPEAGDVDVRIGTIGSGLSNVVATAVDANKVTMTVDATPSVTTDLHYKIDAQRYQEA